MGNDNERYFFEAMGDSLNLFEAFIKRVYSTLNYDEKGKSTDEVCKELGVEDNFQVTRALSRLEENGYIRNGKTREIAGYDGDDFGQGWLFTHRKTTKEEREEMIKCLKEQKSPLAQFITDMPFIEALSVDDKDRKMEELTKMLSPKTCIRCPTIIDENTTGKYETADGNVCKHCFCEMLGEEIEQHPLYAPPPGL